MHFLRFENLRSKSISTNLVCHFPCQHSLSNVFVYWLAALAQPASSCPWLAGNRGHVADQVSFQGLVAGT